MTRLALLACVVLAACGPGEEAEGPSLLLVTVDTLRADRVGCYGDPWARTPVMDRLARQGMQFEHAFAAAPITLPSHATLLTGEPPPRHGVRNNGTHRLATGPWTLTQHLAGAGLATAAFVSADPLHPRHGLDRGFERYDAEFPARPGGRHSFAERRGGSTVESALAWLEERKARFFAWIHLFDPHAPYDPPESPPFAAWMEGDPYAGEVAYADWCLGKLLEARPARDAAVVVTSDHGEGLGDHDEPSHALLVFDTTIRVPLLARAAGTPSLPADRRLIDAPCAPIDVAPLLARLAGHEAPASLPGRDPLATTGAGSDERAIYAESAYAWLEYGWSPLRVLRRGRHKLIHAGARSRLYDLARDPGELHDLAPTRPDLRRELERALADRAVEPAGPIEDADGARLRELGYAAGAGRGIGVPPPRVASERGLPDPAERMARVAAIEEAKRASNEGFTASAVEKLRRLADRDPGNPNVRFLLGTELRRLARRGRPDREARLDEAASELERAIALRPRFTPARNVLLQVRLSQEAFEEARAIADESRELGAQDADTHFIRSLLYSHPASPYHDPAGAERCLRAALALDPSHAAARTALDHLANRPPSGE